MRPHLAIAILLLSPFASTAAPTFVQGFPAALEAAKSANTPVAVFVHGSSWHPASKKFRSDLWLSKKLADSLSDKVILTEINVPQLLDKEESKIFTDSVKPWNQKSVSSYPAIQFYAPDGLLLKTYRGKEILIFNSPEVIASHINQLTALSNTRTDLQTKIQTAHTAKDKTTGTKLLASLAALPIDKDPKILEQLKVADPNDSTGWQARLSFKNWDYIRHISTLIGKKEISEAREDVESKLNSLHYTKTQKTYIYGAMARVLVAENNLDEAWEYCKKAETNNPGSPEAIAIIEYGKMTTGHPKTDSVIP